MTEASYETMTFYYLVGSGCVALAMAMSGKTLFETYRDRRQTKQFLLLKRRLSSAGGSQGSSRRSAGKYPVKPLRPEGDSQPLIHSSADRRNNGTFLAHLSRRLTR